MEYNDLYFVHYRNGEVRRIAKIEDGCVAFGFDKKDKKWVPMQGLIKILFDGLCGYDEITKEEAERLIQAM